MSDDKKRVLKDISEGLSADTILSSHREIHEHKEAMKSTSGKLREARKRMEKNGVNLKAYDDAVRYSKMPLAEALTHLTRVAYALQVMHSPLGAQLALIGIEDPNLPKTEAERLKGWYSEGYNACANGQAEKNCPHSPAMPAGQEWLKGFRDCHSAAVKQQTDAEMKAENPVDTVGKAPAPPPPADDDAADEPAGEASAPAAAAAAEAPATEERRGRGRPKGSTNKPKLALVSSGPVTITNSGPVTEQEVDLVGTKAPPAPPPEDDGEIEDFDAPPAQAKTVGAPPPPPMFD